MNTYLRFSGGFLLGVLLFQVRAAITINPPDLITQSKWRTSAALEVDNEYGSDGYVIYGLRVSDSVWARPYNTSFDNPQNGFSFPSYIHNIELIENNTGMWSGSGNFGLIEDPTADNTLTNTPVIAWGADPYVFTITRASSEAFRLTIIYATGDGQTPTWTTTVDDGTGPVTNAVTALASPNIVYLTFDINSGSDPITVSIEADTVDGWITGFAFDRAQGGIPARNPNPTHNANDALPLTLLTWTPSPDANFQKVYFGTQAGNLQLIHVLDSNHSVCQPIPYPLDLGRLYFWRVDTLIGTETIPGYEWQFTTRLPLRGDLDMNGRIDGGDLLHLAQQWLNGSCSGDDWCHGVDLDFSGKVDLVDFSRIAAEWQQEVPQDIVFDFETGDLQGWRIVEGSFGQFVCDRSTFHNTGQPYNKQGEYFLSTLETSRYTPNDGYTGMAESPVFVLLEPDISFLIGGGDRSSDNYVAVCIVDEELNEQEIVRAYGADTETMQRIEQSFVQLVGKTIFLRLVDHATGGWGHVTFDDFSAVGRFNMVLTSRRFSESARKQIGLSSLAKAVQDLIETFDTQYPHGSEFLSQIDTFQSDLEQILNEMSAGDPTAQERLSQLESHIKKLQYEALTANPLVNGQPILFVVRDQYAPDHHNTHTFFPSYDNEMNVGTFRTGGALKKIDLSVGGTVTTLVDAPDGIVRDPDVYFDGTKIVFSLRYTASDNYSIYEVNTDGSGLRQITSASRVSDLDPMYLPDDSIVFSSTREPKYVHCNRHIQCNLYRMDADGANIHQISKNTLFDFQCSLMPDGRVMYSRWEYVDRNFGDAEAIWTCHPDGTNHAHYFGNNTLSPGAILDPRMIPGTQWMICIFGSCHDRPWGALAIVDRRLGVDLPQPGKPNPVKHIWPENAIDLSGGWDGTRVIPLNYGGQYAFDNHVPVNPKYEDPYPLNDTYFLVSRMIGNGEKMGLFLVDVFGNEILLHEEPDDKGCYDPMPLGPRSRPPQIPTLRNFTENTPGTFYVMDVYRGTHMKGVEQGSVKYLRIVEATTKKTWTNPGWPGQGQEAPGMAWHDFYSKKILGTVPVEEDGSAHFEVPAETFVYFQLLDEDGRMIQSMRSGTYVQPGERLGCVGCHESRTESLAWAEDNRYLPLAVQRTPSVMNGQSGRTKEFNFLDDVQPVFTSRCVSCHGFDTPGGAKASLVLEPDKTVYFNTSYNELWRKGYTGAIGAGPAPIQEAFSWGSHESPLIKALFDADHSDLVLTQEEFDHVITWIDLNAPYYPVYTSAYPNNPAGRSPLTSGQLSSLSSLTGYSFSPMAEPALNFDRPEKSLCLQGLSDTVYSQALSIIQTGHDNLLLYPRADMPGHVPCAVDAVRLDKYELRKNIELVNRQAIREGWKKYDE